MLRFDSFQQIYRTGLLLTIPFGWVILVPTIKPISILAIAARPLSGPRAAAHLISLDWLHPALFRSDSPALQSESNKIVDHYGVADGARVQLVG